MSIKKYKFHRRFPLPGNDNTLTDMHPVLNDLIETFKSFLIVSHKNPDADTIGANCALHLFLKTKQKRVDSFCADTIPDRLQFHPLTKTFLTSITDTTYDVIIYVDCGSIQLTGIEKQLPTTDRSAALVPRSLTLNIDHHQDNNHFGDSNIVDLSASSTSEIIYTLIKDTTLTTEMTQCLLMGIMYDTNFFTNGGTSATAMNTVAAFLRNGSTMQHAITRLWKNKNVPLLQLWGRAFSRLQYNPRFDLAWTLIRARDLEELNLPGFPQDELANYVCSLQDAGVIMVLIETADGSIRGSLRTTKNTCDVSALAKILGGGGHRKAAGFTLPKRVSGVAN
jgi:phosphoesterase RecJ-like protein